MYATLEFYKSIYRGSSIPDEKIQDILERASSDVDIITRRSIHKLGGFDNLSEYEKTQVQMATCHQADHLYTKADVAGLSSYSIGDVSVSFGSTEKYDKDCMQYLNSTRLTYRGL